MIRSVNVTNYLGETLSIDPFDPESSGFLITNLKGITPVSADINLTDITTQDGGLFNSARIQKRNITMALMFMPKPTIEDTRLLSYRYFPVKKQVTLEFETDNRKAQIIGYVEKNDINIYTKAEYSAISIICPDPYFYSTSPDTDINTVFSGTVPAFRFSFPSHSDAAPDLIFGKMRSVNERIIKYTGDAEIGMEIIIRTTGAVGDVTIYNRITQESMILKADKLAALTGSSLIAGDVTTINTYRGNKKIELLRNGVVTNILNCLDKNADWLQLRKGNNTIAFNASSGVLNIQLEVSSKTIYEGL